MRWLAFLVVLAGCAGKHAPPAQAVSLVLDIPHGPLDPAGYATVEVVLHEPTGDVTRTASVAADGSFDLGDLDPSTSVSVEATLRNDSGAAVGYGRTGTAAAIAAGTDIVVPVRRPIAYIAGTVSRGTTKDPTVLMWSESPATYSDLTVGGNPDGTAQIASPQAVMTTAAGPDLFLVTQAVTSTTGVLTGPATIMPVSTADHSVGAALSGSMAGAMLDGAGSDDGTTLVFGTTTELYAVDTATGNVQTLADGAFARVAIVTTDAGEIDAVAIKNRGSTTSATCSTQAEVWWATLSGGAASAHMVATGGFADVAADRGHAYFVDACSGQLGEVTTGAATALRSITDGVTGEPTALAVSNGQAYVGVETAPATTSLVVAAIATTSDLRTLWTEPAQQVVDAVGFDGVLRQLDATSAVFNHLEVGAGGDYVALTTSATFEGEAEADFPQFTMMQTDELRVFDGVTGGAVQRYRSWCDGVVIPQGNDIGPWECAAASQQGVPLPPANASSTTYDHHIGSMTFMFGKK